MYMTGFVTVWSDYLFLYQILYLATPVFKINASRFSFCVVNFFFPFINQCFLSSQIALTCPPGPGFQIALACPPGPGFLV